MKRIIVLSDTHGLLRPEVMEYLPQAGAVIHGGDINIQVEKVVILHEKGRA